MSTPSLMRAVAITAPGEPDVLQLVDQPVPAIGPGDVLIRVAAAGVNGPDIAQRRGRYAPPPDASPLPGLEVAGEIVKAGAGVSGFEVGDRVMALTNGGGYAEYVAVPAGQVLPLPAGWTLSEAAALPETWFTVTQTLVMRSGLLPGMTVLVHGASGGIGGAAVQITALLGARPIAVVSSAAKAAYATTLGADAVIDTSREDLAERVRAITGGAGIDRVVDLVGGAMTAVNIDLCATGGHIVQVATLGGAEATVPLFKLMAKQLTLSGSTLRPQSRETKAAIAARIRADLLPGLSRAGTPRPRLTPFPLEAAAEAHRLMEGRGHIGKMVLETDFGRQLTE